MEQQNAKITRLWLTTIHVSDMDKALKFYHEVLGLPIALDAREFNHAEVGPGEPLAKMLERAEFRASGGQAATRAR